MRFEDAVVALTEEKCKGIKRSNFESIFVLKSNKRSLLNQSNDSAISNYNWFLADDWELVEPIKQYEESEIVKFYCDICCKTFGCDLGYHCGVELTKLTGVIKKEVKPTVKRKIKLNHVASLLIGIRENTIPSNASITVEWEE